jgi:hypothetical protein
MRRTCVVVLSALLGLTLALPSAAQWKWRDKGGQIQYSDLAPPPGTPEQDILQRPTQAQPRRVSVVSAPASAASAAKGVDPELEARRKKAEQEQADKQKADDERIAAAKADNCARARSYMRALDDGLRIVRNNDKGEREFIDDKQRAEEVRRTRETIASDCK